MLEEKENIKMSKTKKREPDNKQQAAKPRKSKKTAKAVGRYTIGAREATKNRTICLLCLEDNNEDWIQCCNCKKWAHEACADVPECSEQYICDHCKFQ